MNILAVIATLCVLLPSALCRAQSATSDTISRYEQPTLLTGTIYESHSNTNRALYKFKRTVTRSGNTIRALREYSYPDGKLAARELTVYEGDNLVSYELEELQINARGTASLSRKLPSKHTITFQYIADIGKPGKVKTNDEKLQPDTLVNDMIAPFLAARWEELIKGKEITCRYIAAARAETVGFTFVKHSESKLDGKPVVIVKMSPTSFIISALVEPLYFTMEKSGDHRVLKYDGRTTPKVQDGKKWKDLDAVTVFDWK